MIECGKLFTGAALPAIHNLNGNLLSERLRTTTTILPSGLRNAVACNLSRFDEQLILFAPGLMNLEK